MREILPFGPPGFFYEGLRWREGRWWLSDMYGGVVLSLDTSGTAREEARIEGDRPSGLGWLPDGSLLIVSMQDKRLLRRPPNAHRLELHADLAPLCGEVPGFLNDMLVDARGGAYVGYDFDLSGPHRGGGLLLSVAPDGSAAVAARDLGFPNGTMIDSAGRLIVAETLGSRLSTFDVAADGSLGPARTWADLGAAGDGGHRIGPDGCAIDAEDHVWVSDTWGGCWRVRRGGEIVDRVDLPEGLNAYACALGGEDGRTLLVSAADRNHQTRAASRDGRLFTARVEVPAAA